MKRIMTWAGIIAFVVFLLDWMIVGLNLLDGNYHITPGVYLALVCLAILFVCSVYRIFSSKCPHCGKLRLTNGKYCPHCGNEI